MNTDRIKKIISFLTPEERGSGVRLLALMLCMGVFEVVGVASVMPFMALVADPDIIRTNVYLSSAYSVLGFVDDTAFLMFSGFAVIALIIISTGFKSFTLYSIYRFTFDREYSVSQRLISGLLNQPYSWFLDQHKSELGKSVLFDVREVVSRCLLTSMMLISNLSVVFLLLTMLILVDPWTAISVFLFYGFVYSVLYLGVSKVLERIGKERLKTNEVRYKVTSEAMALVKELKVLGNEAHYLSLFNKATRNFVNKEVLTQSISSLPRYGIEMVTFGGIIAVLLMNLRNDAALVDVLPLLSLYAFAVYRLMPALQVVFSSVTLFKASASVLDSLSLKFEELGRPAVVSGSDQRLPFKNEISLLGVDYSYPKSESKALSNLSMTIEANKIIGIIGSTGSGKTTTVDVLLGLLEPDKGALYVDGVKISSANVTQWRLCIGYVPQQITLVDDTVVSNIALGVPKDEIDMEAVFYAAQVANIHQFITRDLEGGYDARVGDNGVKLSGGQRQRIGIARALYTRPDLLVLDEATSALDNETEQIVMDAVNNLDREITIVMIAHRLSTLSEADVVYKLEKGKLHSTGSYRDLTGSSTR